MFNRILVPFDGSVGGEQALIKAVELAKVTGAEIQVLTVYRHHSMLEASFSMVRASDPGNMDDAMRSHAREVAEHAKKLAKEHGAETVRAFVKTGQPARTIVRFANEHECDLIVLGARGMGSVEGYLLGSVSHKVTGLSRVPVLVV
ncbi:universal stress protein [Lutimaribacter sp. EGI FJ00015]|uniref:Universal stress protein n=1 Tax=Lutimaribacter degradans TaxID=2945989 RepID=A0ACC5ZYF0_9RHOB|nr:universal stress protein [Lutimaribacter sp. EGI FJ00013]MCM2563130.1 universal stress protein [Lutimaribacter sp. EGI FJ00013]MCO0614309.1 universal stress protein [Lutimaribacter sp. EGI FJ00015]MCO0637119.1 universal stress protein [Lutimaribacter sp. EGI FJ00014]